MAHLTYRDSLTPTVPTSTTAKGSGLDNNEIDGNFKSLNDNKLELAGGTLTGAVSINNIDNALVVQHNGGAGAWSGRILSKNSSADVSSFLGNYNGKAGVFAHNNALSGWTPLYLNTLGSNGSNIVYLPHANSFTIDSSNNTYPLLTAANYTSYADPIPTLGVPRNNLGDPTVREMALFDSEFTNKIDLYDITKLFIETSTDNINWTTHSENDTNKRRLLGGDSAYSGLTIPYGTQYFRIRLRANSYVYLNALYSYWSSNGHSTKVKIYTKHDLDSGWSVVANSSNTVSSWPGHLYLPHNTIPWHLSGAQGNHYHEVYVVFEPTWNVAYSANPISLYKLQWWGGYPAGRRNVYSTDEFGGVAFPSTLSAVNAITQNGNQVLHAGNYSSYALPLTGGILTGARPITFDPANGDIEIKGDAGGWATGLYFIGSSNTYRGGFGALGSGDALSNFWIGPAYNNTWMTISSSAVNTQVALQQSGNQVLHAGNYSSYAMPLSGGTFTGLVTVPTQFTVNAQGAEGGEIVLKKGTEQTGLNGDVHLDTIANVFRIFENGGAGRQFQFDLTSGLISGFNGITANINGSAAQLGGNSSSSYSGPSSAVKQFFWDNLSAAATQAKTFEIARISIDYNDWNETGPVEVELYEAYYSRGLKKRYVINWGYTNSYGIQLTEYSGSGDNNFQCRIGTPVLVSGDIYYLPVYIDVRYYSMVDVRVTTNRNITATNPPTSAGMYINASPTATDIAGFTADSIVNISSVATVQINGNQLLHASNYNSYSPTLTGGGATGTWGISITGNAATVTNGLTTVNAAGIYLKGTATYAPYQSWNTTGNDQNTIYQIIQENFNLAGATGNSDFPASRSYNYGILANLSSASSGRAQIYISHAGNDLIFRGGWGNDSWQAWNKVLTDQNYSSYSPSLTGGNASGTWGISVSGSAATLTTARTLTIGDTGKTFNGGADVSWSLSEIGALPLTGGTLTGTLKINTTSSGSSASHVIIKRSGAAEPASFGSYPGSWRSNLEIWNNDSTKMLFVGPPENDSLYANIKSVGGGFLIDVGSNGGTRAIQIESSGAANFPVSLSRGGNAVLDAGNYNSYSPTLTGTGASGTWSINITGAAGDTSAIAGYNINWSYVAGSPYYIWGTAVGSGITRVYSASEITVGSATNATNATNAIRIQYNDGPRDLSDRLPNSFARTVNFDFVNAGVANGVGNYAGVMTYSPWTGTTASTGDSSYQLAFANTTGVNASGQPKLSIRNGIDTTWNAWYTLLHSGNYNSYALPLSGGTLTGQITSQRNDSGIVLESQNSSASNATQFFIQHSLGNVNIGNLRAGGALNVSAGALQQGGNQVLHAGNYTSYALPLTGGTITGGVLLSTGGSSQLQINSPNNTQGLWIRTGYDANGTATPQSAPFNVQFQSSGSSAGTFTFVTGNDRTLSISGSAVNSLVALQQSGNQVLHASNFTSYAAPAKVRTDWNSGTSAVPYVSGQLAWRNYGNSHTIVDVSSGTVPSGTSTSSTNPDVTWTSSYPTLVGWNGSSTYGVRVDSSRYADKATRSNGNFYIDDNYGLGIVGVYSSYRYQGVFAMGDSYKLPADGTTTGSLYGMAWSHPNAGGIAGNLDSHGLLVLINGGFGSAMSYSIVASGNVTAYSDERLKTNWRSMPTDYVAKLAQVKVGVYERTDGEKITQVGVSAQSLRQVLPEAIIEATDDIKTLSVNYGGAALASAVELAKDNVELRRRIERLEAIIETLLNKE